MLFSTPIAIDEDDSTDDVYAARREIEAAARGGTRACLSVVYINAPDMETEADGRTDADGARFNRYPGTVYMYGKKRSAF